MKFNCRFAHLWPVLWIIPSILIVIYSCSCGKNDRAVEEYLTKYNDWKDTRIRSLKGHEGWLNLAGLFWLEEGENPFGSDSSNSIIFPPVAPAKIGVIILKEDKIRILVNQGIGVTHKRELIREMDLLPDVSGEPTVLNLDSLAWFIIKRGDRYGIRLRDYNHHNIKK